MHVLAWFISLPWKVKNWRDRPARAQCFLEGTWWIYLTSGRVLGSKQPLRLMSRSSNWQEKSYFAKNNASYTKTIRILKDLQISQGHVGIVGHIILMQCNAQCRELGAIALRLAIAHDLAVAAILESLLVNRRLLSRATWTKHPINTNLTRAAAEQK